MVMLHMLKYPVLPGVQASSAFPACSLGTQPRHLVDTNSLLIVLVSTEQSYCSISGSFKELALQKIWNNGNEHAANVSADRRDRWRSLLINPKRQKRVHSVLHFRFGALGVSWGSWGYYSLFWSEQLFRNNIRPQQLESSRSVNTIQGEKQNTHVTSLIVMNRKGKLNH